jgi:hypothetical protein
MLLSLVLPNAMAAKKLCRVGPSLVTFTTVLLMSDHFVRTFGSMTIAHGSNKP